MNNLLNYNKTEKEILNDFISKKDFYYDEQEQKTKIFELESIFKLSLSKKELEIYHKILNEISTLEKLEMLRLIKFVLSEKE